MISFFLSPYSDSFFTQLNFIEENAWIYYIKSFLIEDSFFKDVIDLKYYPIFLKKKENIDLIFKNKINKVDLILDIHHVVKMYTSKENYSIDFENFIHNCSGEIKHFIQIINKYNFSIVCSDSEYKQLKYTTQFSTFFLHITGNRIKKIDNNKYKNIINQHNFKDGIIKEDGHIFYYISNEKIEK